MTLDQLVDRAAEQMDAIFAQQQDDQLLLMITCGVDEGDALDFLTQRATTYAAWRPQVLADVRREIIQEMQ